MQSPKGLRTPNGERALFDRCLFLEPGERSALLRSLEAEQPDVVARVRRLLDAHAELEAEPGRLARVPRERPDPTQVGPYRVLRRLGQGGMGVVYLAEQEEPIRRIVALKIIRRGFDTADVITRFEAERQALALMSHPNIARILDAGTTPEGRPYFVMEYVRRGEPITGFCDRRRLTVSDRLALFLDVCRAAHHAHANGVVHRDLKPGNILVSDVDGLATPKVIDFGVSKALHAPFVTSYETRAGSPIGTPGYMSPEQVGASTEIDARSDVFSLGAVLYELVTGTVYGDPAPGPAPAVVDAAAQGARPSALVRGLARHRAEAVARARGTTPKQLRRQLKWDVDWIVARALETDADRRYPSAMAMAAELERLLEQRPVSAASGVGYRVVKAVRRNRSHVWTAVLTAAMGAALLLASSPGAPGALDETAVAVLPIGRIGDDFGTLADGLHESLITELTRSRELSVIALGSMVEYAGTRRSFGDIGRELGVGNVLEGTVQRVGDQLRVTMSLVRVADGWQVWSDQYDRPYRLDALLDVQREIAGQVAAALSGTLRPAQPAVTRSLAALEAFYAGNAHAVQRYERAQADSSVLAFERAIELDPEFGVAYATLAEARIWRFWQFAESGDAVRAEAALARARDLAPAAVPTRIAEAAVAYRLHRDFGGALEHLLAAEAIAPGDARIHEGIGYVQRRRGEWDVALAHLEEAARLSPRRPGLHFSLGHTLHMLRRYDDAEMWLDRLTLLDARPGPNGAFEARFELYSSMGDTASLRAFSGGFPSQAQEIERDVATTLAFFQRRYGDAIEAGGTLRVWPFAREMDQAAGRAILYHFAGQNAQRDRVADSLRAAYEEELELRSAEEVNARARAYGGLALAHALMGHRREALAAAKASYGTLSLAVDAYSGRYGEQRLAAVHLLLGNRKEALDLLERLLEVPNELRPALLDLDPRLDGLRGDPRFDSWVAGVRGAP